MQVTFAQQNRLPETLSAPTHFQFCSSHRSLHTSGVAERISAPVLERGNRHHFFTTLRAALQKAQASGIRRPIVVGAIPFDLHQPCSLHIPLEHCFGEIDHGKNEPVSQPVAVVAQRNLPEENRYKQSVRQAIANFQLSDIRKAVLSRVLELQLDSNLPANNIFTCLKSQNPSGYHFSVPLEDGGQLVGVSPELLLRKQGDWLTSNPLAGSSKRRALPAEDRAAADNLQASGKDLYEHRLVIEEIGRVLRPLCTELTIPESPSLLHTETMWHLSTLIQGRLTNRHTSALEIASQLHPTPAVCGYPTNLAHKLINLVEAFDRGLFAGMVGWQDAEGNGEWAVTIRCGIVRGNQLSLFAGAGIVADSCPESEWAETQAKLQTMLRALPFNLENAL